MKKQTCAPGKTPMAPPFTKTPSKAPMKPPMKGGKVKK